MFKKAQLVMLATNKKASNLYIWDNRLYFTNNPKNITEIGGYNKVPTQFQHLYIISDEEIKEGDWYCTLSSDEGILQCSCKEEANDLTNVWKKIIASTDLSLELPQPSQSFIEKYMLEYNKDNTISEVMVEYESDYSIDCNILTENCNDYKRNSFNCNGCDKVKLKLKVNSKDNSITIKKIKDSWNREEMIIIVKKMILEERDYQNKYHHFVDTCDLTNWINKNL